MKPAVPDRVRDDVLNQLAKLIDDRAVDAFFKRYDQIGQGFGIAMESLTNGRLGVSCSCIGTADRLLEMSAAYAKQRNTFGKPLAEPQASQWTPADSAWEPSRARACTLSPLRRVAAGRERAPPPTRTWPTETRPTTRPGRNGPNNSSPGAGSGTVRARNASGTAVHESIS